MDLGKLKTFFMWCTIINGALLVLAVLIGIVGFDLVYNVHGKLFQISRASLHEAYYLFLGIYKIVWLVFNAVPYVALLIIAKKLHPKSQSRQLKENGGQSFTLARLRSISMQCNFCHKEITEGGYVWLNKQWCVMSHVEPPAGAGLPHICNQCSNSLSKKKIIEKLMEQHPAHKHAVASIIDRYKREGCDITFSDREIDALLGLKQPAHGSRDAREDFKFQRKLGLDNIKRDLLYNYNLHFTGTKKTGKGHGGWCLRPC